MRISILVPNTSLLNWQVQLIKSIDELDFVSLGHLVINDLHSEARPNFLYNILTKIDRKLFPVAPDALVENDFKFNNLKQIPLSNFKEEKQDVILNLSTAKTPAWLYTNSTYGIWKLHFSAPEFNSGNAGSFWEVVKQTEETGSVLLCKQAADQKPKKLYSSWGLTDPLSYHRNKNNTIWKSIAFVPRVLKKINEQGASFLEETQAIVPAKNTVLNTPNFVQSFGLLFLQASRLFGRIIHKTLYRDQWYLLYHFGENALDNLNDFKTILPPKDNFWADPFVVEENNKHYLFFEDLPYRTNKGHLSVLELKPDGSYTEPVPILQTDYHLSYPFVFKEAGTYYMIPEAYQSNAIQVYEATDFPYKWKHKMNLMEDVQAFDTSPIYYQGKWWLFCNMAAFKGASGSEELFLFYADKLFTTNWTPHPLNPIVSDVKTARPAGKLFIKDGRLYRPSQDCSKAYGYGLNINEVLELSETNYKEKRVQYVDPKWNAKNKRVHTFNQAGKLSVIDGFLYRSKFF